MDESTLEYITRIDPSDCIRRLICDVSTGHNDFVTLENILKIEPLGKNFIDNLNAVCTCFLYCSHVCSTVLIWAVCYVGASIKGSIITKVIFDFVFFSKNVQNHFLSNLHWV